MSRNLGDVIKKAFTKELYTVNREEELMKCMENPLYFIENYIKVQTTTMGSVPLRLYEYQRNLIRAFDGHKKTICLSGRQQGKCITGSSIIVQNGKTVEIGNMIILTRKEKFISWLEKKLIEYSKK